MTAKIVNTCTLKYSIRKINEKASYYLAERFSVLITFLFAAIAVPYRAITHGFDGAEITMAIVCFIYCGMSIHSGLSPIMVTQNLSGALELTPYLRARRRICLAKQYLHWSSDHRIHHKHVGQ